MVKLHSCFVLKLIFIGLIPNSYCVFTFGPCCFLKPKFPHNIYIIVKNYTNLYNL